MCVKQRIFLHAIPLCFLVSCCHQIVTLRLGIIPYSYRHYAFRDLFHWCLKFLLYFQLNKSSFNKEHWQKTYALVLSNVVLRLNVLGNCIAYKSSQFKLSYGYRNLPSLRNLKQDTIQVYDFGKTWNI